MEKTNTWKALSKHLLIFLFVFAVFAMIYHTEANAASVKNGYYSIRAGVNTNLALDVQDWNTENGGNFQVWKWGKTTNQIFYIKYEGRNQDGEWYSIQALHSGKVLDVFNNQDADGTNCHQWTMKKNKKGQVLKTQIWSFMDAGNGYYRIRCGNGKFLDNSSNIDANGNNVQIWKDNGTTAQKWKLYKVSKPKMTAKVSNKSLPKGTYKYGNIKISMNIYNASYPIQKIECKFTNRATKRTMTCPVSYSGKLSNSKDFKANIGVGKFTTGQYRFELYIVNWKGEKGTIAASNFSVKR